MGNRKSKAPLPAVPAAAIEAYGALKEGVHVAGYTLERALDKLYALLKGDQWKGVGGGFADVNAFIDSIKLDNFRMVAEQRARIAKRIKQLQPKASNRRVAKLLGVDEKTLRNDGAEKSAPAANKSNNDSASNGADAEKSAPEISGAEAAKIVQRRTADVAKTQERASRHHAAVVVSTKMTATASKIRKRITVHLR